MYRRFITGLQAACGLAGLRQACRYCIVCIDCKWGIVIFFSGWDWMELENLGSGSGKVGTK